ncbi:MAG TPA: DUF5777 family beta-barrel protein [Cyclobacteriaceae bacterium]|nr:DUF5777 family beta-barrel protein [Cyclobacteriaceae bacterium]HNP08481.1 DUF5777 family beta-barrel protein [Cyclobacteriaceae bacterium]
MNRVYLLALMCWVSFFAYAQDDLMAELQDAQPEKTEYAIQTFRGTRIINGHSVETKGKGELEFIFSHRFGPLNSGAYNFWGLDDAFVRLGIEYGITDRLGVGIGRSSTDKTFDGFVRYKVLRQSHGVTNIPFTLTAIGSGYIKTSPQAKFNPQVSTKDRMAYSLELLIGKKFSPNFSLQISPVLVHRITVNPMFENNDDVALGIGGKHNITRSLAVTGEYFYRVNPHTNSTRSDAIGLGLEIETGGHVFQLIFTNSLGLFTRSVVSETQGDFFDGDVHFGFNISRNFQLIHKK